MSAIFGVYYSRSQLPAVVRKYLELSEADPPEIIHHYSSAAGAVAILKTRSLWATNASYVNDATELTYGNALLNSVLTERHGRLGAVPQWVGEVLPMVGDFISGGAVYMACFCEAPDLLSQWRGYGTEGGVALGLDTGLLSRDGRGLLLKVVYDPSSQRRLFERVIDAFEAEVSTPAVSDVDMEPFFANSRLAIALALCLTACKHPSFSEEREWRLLPLSLPEIQFRVEGGWVKPYIEFELTSERVPVMPLRAVTIGPGRHASLTKQSLQMLMPQLGLRGVPITVSHVPLR